MKLGKLIAVVACFCVAVQVSAEELEKDTCVLEAEGTELSAEKQSRLAFFVTQNDQKVSFTCPAGSPLDPSRAPQGRAYQVSEDGTKCRSSESTLSLAEKVPGAYLKITEGGDLAVTTYTLFVPKLPLTQAKLCFSCSGKSQKKQDCPVVITIAPQNDAIRSREGPIVCNGDAEKRITVFEPQTVSLVCGTSTPTLDPTVDSGDVYIGDDCSKKAKLGDVLSDATLKESVVDGTSSTQPGDGEQGHASVNEKPGEGSSTQTPAATKKEYVLSVAKVPETEKKICLKCVTSNETCTFKFSVGKDAERDSAGFRLSVVTGIAVSFFVLATVSLVR